MIQVHCFVCNAFEENTYVVYDATRACAIIDPGCHTAEEQQALSCFINEHGLQVTRLINTHGHIDHVLGNHYVQATYGTPLSLHTQEVAMLQAMVQHAPAYGLADYVPVEPASLLEEGDVVQVGTISLQVLHVPGHSPGHLALYSAADLCCFSGDVLFQGGIGRTDLPGGDHDVLLQSIRQKLLPLGDEMMVYPGHGPTTTIGRERRHNAFL